MRRRIIKPKTPIFLGCEGESEQAYGQLLNDLLQAAGRPVHLEVVNLSPGAGDPISRLRRAAQEIDRRRRRRSEFARRAVLLDLDQMQNDNQRRQQAEQLANQLDVRIIWQDPCTIFSYRDGKTNGKANRACWTPAAVFGTTNTPTKRSPTNMAPLAKPR